MVFGKASGFGASFELSSLASGDGSTGFVINGDTSLDESGRSVSSAGDVNGDGFDDLIIGAHLGDPGGVFGAGESYVVFGKASGFGASFELSSLAGGNGSTGFVLNGSDFVGLSGWSVSSAGDVNGDGFDDVMVGAFRADPDGNGDAGESYVVFGKAGGFSGSIDLSSLDGSTGFVLKGFEASSNSGWSVSSAGDLNSDGFDDVIIGAPAVNPPLQQEAGQSYVVFGKAGGFATSIDLSGLDGSTGFAITGISLMDQLGYAVSAAGDVNDDGVDDVIIGAPGGDPNGQLSSGESYILFGRGGPTEDRPFAIDVSAAVTDTVDNAHSTESIGALTLSGLPAGFTISDGTAPNTATSIGMGDAIDILGWDLDALTITPAPDYSGTITLSVSATATESANGDTSSSTATLPVDIAAIQDPAIIGGQTSGSVTEDTNVQPGDQLQASGALTISDADGPSEELFVAQSIGTLKNGDAALGTLSIAANGDWDYSIDNLDFDVQRLLTGESFSEVFEVESADGTTQDVTITVNGIDDSGFKLTASNGQASDRFGLGVDTTATGDIFAISGGNSVYLFDRNGNELTEIPSASNVNAVESIAISSDGTTVVGGDPFDATNGAGAGIARVFDGNGNAVSTLMPGSPSPNSTFGDSIATSSDGSRIIVGSSTEDNSLGFNAGSAYLFDRSGVQLSQLTASDGAVVDLFGSQVDISADGSRIVVGSSNNSGAGVGTGAAYVFDGSGNQLFKLTASDAWALDRFGSQVAISEDGGTIVVTKTDNLTSAGTTSSAIVYDGSGNEIAKLFPSGVGSVDLYNANMSVDVSADGNTIVLGTSSNTENGINSGAAYVFDRSGNELAELTAFDAAEADIFGISVSVSDDGSTIIVGSAQDDDVGDASGSSYVFFKNVNGDYVGPNGIVYSTGGADPVIVDLDGDGIETLAANDAFQFDIDADGEDEAIGWVGPDDGLLAMDLDNSGAIEDGSELFSENFNGGGFSSSIEALASLDANGDTFIDANDSGYSDILVWRDANSDGVSQQSELSSLYDNGIASIHLDAEFAEQDSNGNTIFANGDFFTVDGGIGSYAGVDFGFL